MGLAKYKFREMERRDGAVVKNLLDISDKTETAELAHSHIVSLLRGFFNHPL